MNFENPREFSAKLWESGVKAIKNRCTVFGLPFDPLDLYLYTCWLASTSMFKQQAYIDLPLGDGIHQGNRRRFLSRVEANDVLRHFCLNAHRYPSPTPREIVNMAKVRIGRSREEWEQRIERLLTGAWVFPDARWCFTIGDDPCELIRVQSDERTEGGYWLSPPELRVELERICAELNLPPIDWTFDPCPYPLPPGFDGLSIPWGFNRTLHVNPPFRAADELHGRGPLSWIEKSIEETKNGNTVLLAIPPMASHTQRLAEVGAEMVPLGRVHWRHTETGEPMRGGPLTMLFIIRRGVDTTPVRKRQDAAEMYMAVQAGRCAGSPAASAASLRAPDEKIV
jgi:hypothetical protein